MSALTQLRRLVLHHKDEVWSDLETNLREIMLKLNDNIVDMRTSLARNALRCVAEMFASLGYAMVRCVGV